MSNEAPVVRCWNCNLNQFEAVYCRKCRRPLEKPKPEADAPVYAKSLSEEAVQKVSKYDPMAVLIGERISKIRSGRDISQRELSEIIKCPRTYISKIENGKALPCLRQIKRLCRGLNVSVVDLLSTDRERDIRGLSNDPFMLKMIEAGRKMPPLYWRRIAQEAERLSNGKRIAVSS